MNAMASLDEDDREDPFSLFENSDVEEAAIVVDSDKRTDTFSRHLAERKYITFEHDFSKKYI